MARPARECIVRTLTSEGAGTVDELAARDLGISAAVLMENAGRAVAEVARRRFPEAVRVAIVCGGGSNGGDGLVAACYLLEAGLEVSLLLCRQEKEYRGEAARQLQRARGVGLEPLELMGEAHELEAREAAWASLRAADLVIDALFGTGLSRPVEGQWAVLLERLQELKKPILSIDVPSGLDADSGLCPQSHLTADATVTFFAPKVAHVLVPAADAMGEVWLSGLTVPLGMVESHGSSVLLMEATDLPLPARDRAGHKGSFGHLLLIAGSKGKTGACSLAAEASLRSGAGMVTSAVAAAIADEVDAACLEGMTLSLEADASGALGDIASAALRDALAGKAALAIGPGLGADRQTSSWVRALVLETSLPLVLDADGINAFEGRADELRQRAGPTLLTPHPAEIARLLGGSKPRGPEERLATVREASRRTGAVVVLKGRGSLIADPQGEVWVNPTGNAGMATAGSGDVLTGVIGGLLAQGCEAGAAGRLGVFVHGLAGDLARLDWGERGMLAGDLIRYLPMALDRLANAEHPAGNGLRKIGRAQIIEMLRGKAQ